MARATAFNFAFFTHTFCHANIQQHYRTANAQDQEYSEFQIKIDKRNNARINPVRIGANMNILFNITLEKMAVFNR